LIGEPQNDGIEVRDVFEDACKYCHVKLEMAEVRQRPRIQVENNRVPASIDDIGRNVATARVEI
jgi:hypothetical protein